jgi:hypothetical protein
MFEALAYIAYLIERYYFSLVCTSKKVVKTYDVKVDVQKGPQKFSGNLMVDIIVTFIYCCHMVIILVKSFL